jgi:catechol 2,3-dioxygenase-like lactoylglutathione lyase family enzyme
MDYRLEAIIIPVSDVDRAKAFYEKAGFTLDVDHQPNDEFRVVQFTPPGSPTSIVFGKGVSQSEPGSYGGLHLVVSDIEAARADLAAREIEIGDLFHFGAAGQAPGLHPDRIDYGTYLAFSDPDGNGWLVQEVRSRSATS